MARHTIFGPQVQDEKAAEDLRRDTRPWRVRWREKLRSGTTCAGILGAGAALVALVPGTVEFVFPPAALYGVGVLCGRVRLPLRVPMKARLRDPTDLDERGKPRLGQGADVVGFELNTGRQVWLGLEDIPQHGAIPGTTGSGKTEAMKWISVVNALAQGSGVLYIDGKAQKKLYAEIMAAARYAGREDDVFPVNFLSATGDLDSCTLAPFAQARANMIREILVGQLNEPGSEGNGGVFFGRAVAFLGTIAPILEWMRENRGVPTTLERVRDLTELANVVRIATKRQVKLTDSKTGHSQVLDLADLPNEYVQALRDYLGQTGGFDLDVSIKEQRSTQPAEQHSYIAMQFTEVFSQWLVTLGHIFRTESGDIDMRDVVLNRRIVVVMLPVLEGSEKTTAALGKIIVAMLKAVMAVSLGGKVEGQYDEIIQNQPSEALASFRVVLDELVYYATNGMDAMLAMARSLRMQFLLGFQEAAGMRARLGEKMYSLLGNANFQAIMRLQEGGETRSYVEKTVGETQVTQSTSFVSTSEFTEGHAAASHAEVREVSRVNWNDVRKLRPGEAILVFGRHLVHAYIPRAIVPLDGLVRRNRPGVLPAPKAEDIGRHLAGVAAVRRALVKGAGAADTAEDGGETGLRLLLDAYAARLGAGVAPAAAGLHAALSLPSDLPAAPPAPPPAEAGGEPKAPPAHALTATLQAVSAGTGQDGEAGTAEAGPVRAADRDLVKTLVAIERAGGLTIAGAQIAARDALALRDAAIRPPEHMRLPAVPVEHLAELVEALAEAVARRPEDDDVTAQADRPLQPAI